MRLHEKFRKPVITEALTLAKNAVLRVYTSGGVEKEISQDELANLDALSDELAALAGLTASAAELNAVADKSAKYETLSDTTTIVAGDDEKVFLLDDATGFTATLPAPALGLKFRFVVKTAPTSGNYNIATDSGADIIQGSVGEAVTATGPVDANADNIAFASGVALAGDWVEVESDGTSWFLRGQTQADNAVVLSTA